MYLPAGYLGIGSAECQARGCCWGPVDDPTGNTPWCYISPTSYPSYKVTNNTLQGEPHVPILCSTCASHHMAYSITWPATWPSFAWSMPNTCCMGPCRAMHQPAPPACTTAAAQPTGITLSSTQQVRPRSPAAAAAAQAAVSMHIAHPLPHPACRRQLHAAAAARAARPGPVWPRL
jgi:hypothetical protein